jgi:rfaE bifunctional protein nucleotidyltransferase chain/domain
MSTIVITREEARRLRDNYRQAGKTVGFTSGVFDILHAGHVEYLERAAELVEVLFVGVNSDSSVKVNKGDLRPINHQAQRAEVVGSLKSVAHVFVFEELNNNVNIEALKPDLYIKAGDYTADKLTSKHIVESYGGRVEILPFKEGHSTTSIIEKIAMGSVTCEGPHIPRKRAPAVFVDRDGTINEHVEYLSEPGRFVEIPKSFAALKRLKELGYRVVIVTNQPGIGLGYFTKEDFYAVNREMMRQATAVGGAIDKIYFCPHSKAEKCPCRKPDPYFLKRAVEELNIDLGSSFVIGDMTSDVQLGKNAGCRSILVQTGRAGDDGLYKAEADYVAKDLSDAAAWIEKQEMNITTVSEAEESSAVPEPLPHDALSVGAGSKENGAPGAGGDRLATTVSADFNNIFGSILGCATLIAQKAGVGSSGAGVDDALTILRKAANRGLAISKKMNSLLFSGEGARGRKSLQSCIESVVELLSSSHGDECQIEVICPQDIEVEMADFAVVQMLLELCENSLEAMKTLPERFILFHVEPVELSDKAEALELTPGSYAKVSLVDHGDGIDPERCEVVFQPFSSGKNRDDGTGLGLSLSMAKSVMKKHGGTITLASRPQTGTNLSLYFPVARPPA